MGLDRTRRLNYGTRVAFEFTIQSDWHAEAFRRGSSYLVVINIGYDPVIDHTYSIIVGLEGAVGGGMEYFFSILDADNRNNTEIELHSGLETTILFSKEQRIAVLKAVLDATKVLLNQVNPDRVSWFTWDADLPEKALAKYLQVADIFEMCGYRVHTSDAYHGRYAWWAERARGGGVGQGDQGG